jgi:hypothetical protein
MSQPITDYSTETPEKIANRLEYLKEKTTLNDDEYRLNTISHAETGEIVDAVNALTTRAGANPATSVTTSSAELNTLKAEIKQAQEDLQIAEERVASLRNPGKDKSYYESWFPINRPFTQTTIVILLAIGIFFFVLSFLIIIKGLGFNLSITYPWDNSEFTPKLLALFPPILVNNFRYIVLGIIFILIILIVVKK